MGNIYGFIQQHGAWIYPLTVVGTFLEGETFVLLAAAAATALRLDPLVLCACAWFGSAAGDQSWFFAGRVCGPWIMRRSAKARAGIGLAHRWLERWDALFILSYRFMYGVRNVSSIALGLSDVASHRFIVLNTIAAGLWAATFVGAGVLFGNAAGELLGRWAATIEIGLAVFFVLLVLAIGLVGNETGLLLTRQVTLLQRWVTAWSRRS
jgi:membrane protein DedA with SNARE-associated domain